MSRRCQNALLDTFLAWQIISWFKKVERFVLAGIANQLRLEEYHWLKLGPYCHVSFIGDDELCYFIVQTLGSMM